MRHGRVAEPFDERPRDTRLHRGDEHAASTTRVAASGRAPRRSAGACPGCGRCRSIISRYVMTSGPPASNDRPSISSRPAAAARYAAMSASAIGCVGVETQRGQIIPGRRSTSATIVSKAALPAPITIAARKVVTGTAPEARIVRRLGAAAQVRREVRRRRRRDRRGRPAAAPRLVRPPARRSRPRDGRAPRSRRCRANGRGSRRRRRPRGPAAARPVGRVGGLPANAVAVVSAAGGDGQDVVLSREQRHERAADGAGGAEHGDPHRRSLRRSRSK